MSKPVEVQPETGTVSALPVELELLLGLGGEGNTLVLAPHGRCLDLQPWLLDCVAAKVTCLGHQDEMPRTWDWENALAMLEPGEELIYALDHVAGQRSIGRPFTLWLGIRFPRTPRLAMPDLDRRAKRVRLLMSQFQRQAFPGSELEWIDPAALPAHLGRVSGAQQRCVCVSGLPSPRDLEDEHPHADRTSATRNYQSLNDVADSLVELTSDYRIAFIVERVDGETLKAGLGQAARLRDAIHPYIRTTAQAGGSRGNNQSRQDSSSIGSSTTEQSSSNTGGSSSAQRTDGWLKSAWNSLGDAFHPFREHATGGRTNGSSWSRTSSNSTGTTRNTTSGTSSGTSEEANWNQSQERLQSMLELADRSLERTMAALHEAHGSGGYRWSAFITADGVDADLIAGSLIGVLAGSRTKDFPFNRFNVVGAGSTLLLGSESLLDLVSEAAPILPLARVCEALLLPEAELQGLGLRRNVFLGRTSSPRGFGEDTVELGPDAFGALGGRTAENAIVIDRDDLFRHLLVAGTTGSGKTTRVIEILNQLKDDHLGIIVFETAKRTYRKRLQRLGRPAPLVYRLGDSTRIPDCRFRPLRVNPFYFELGTSLKRHIAVLADALAELMPTEAMIGPLMRRAVEAIYHERGWDIEHGRPAAGGSPEWPTVLDFAAQVRLLADSLNYGPEVSANYRGALESRAALFLDATFQDLFSHDGNAPVDELFPPGRDAIIEVEDLPPSDVDVRAFIMTLLLDRLRCVQAVRLGEPTPTLATDGLVETTSIGDLIQNHLRDQGLPPAGLRKRLLREGKVKVGGVAVYKPDLRVTAATPVSIDGVPVWPRCTPAPAPRDPRRWLIVVEEAHNVLDRALEERRPGDESNAGRTLLRCIDRLLQEGRELEIGVMVVDQSPVRLARSVISNTGTKIIMRLEDGQEMEEIGRAIGLDEASWKKLGFLQQGEALVKASYMDAPVKTAPFPQRTPGPAEESGPQAGATPSYTALEGLWAPVLAGVRTPDQYWLDELLTAAAGVPGLAVYAGAKAQLEAWRQQPGVQDPSGHLRSLLVRPDLCAGDLLPAAEAIHARNFYWPLLIVARTMFRALLPGGGPDPQATMSLVGLRRAADLIAASGIGEAGAWCDLLFGLSGGAAEWEWASTHFQDYCRHTGRGDETAALRILLVRIAADPPGQAARWANTALADRMQFAFEVRAFLAQVTGWGQSELPDTTLATRARELIARITYWLGLDLASIPGPAALACHQPDPEGGAPW